MKEIAGSATASAREKSSSPNDPPIFFCDAMLGGLSRWLRAAGYDARFEHGIDDGELVRRTQESSGVLLSSDGPLFLRQPVRKGLITSLFVPRGLDVAAQLAFVLRELGLPLCESRCMSCGGELEEVDKAAVQSLIPPRTLERCDRYWRCRRCAHLFWRGTHWSKIAHRLRTALSP